jgi:hypothetical protein
LIKKIIYKNKVYDILIHEDDELDYMCFTWRILKGQSTFYVQAHTHMVYGKRKIIRLHNYLTGYKFVDHINGNGLDNRRKNLRESNHQLNARNRTRKIKSNSKYKGVIKQNQTNKSGWIARIIIDSKQIYLGTFKLEIDAAIAYNEAAIKHFGEHASLNYLEVSNRPF